MAPILNVTIIFKDGAKKTYGVIKLEAHAGGFLRLRFRGGETEHIHTKDVSILNLMPSNHHAPAEKVSAIEAYDAG